MSLHDYYLKFKKIQEALKDNKEQINQLQNSELEVEVEEFNLIADDLKDNIRNYLRQLSNTMLKIVRLSDGELVIKDGKVLYDGFNRVVSFNYETMVEVAQECVKQINKSIQLISMNGANSIELKKLGYALNTLYEIFEQSSDLEQYAKNEYEKKYASKKKELELSYQKFNSDKNKQLKELEHQKEQLIKQYDYLAKEISDSSDKFKSKIDKNITIEEFIKNEKQLSLVNHEVPIAIKMNSYSKEFFEFVKNKVGIDISDCGEVISLNKEHPLLFIETPKEILDTDFFVDRRNDYFGHIIDNAILHFEHDKLMFAFAEYAMGVKNFIPIGNRLSYLSLNLISLNKVYENDTQSVREVLDHIYQIVTERDELFKTRRINDIDEYNHKNSNNTLPYVLFIFKDFLSLERNSGFNKTNYDKLLYILENGGYCGVYTILIGTNRDIPAEYYGGQEIPKLNLKALNSEIIEIRNENGEKNILNEDKEISFVKFPFSNITIEEIYSQREKNKDKFYLKDILEENNDKQPFYEMIRIPIGESDGKRIYYESSTSHAPYPFTVVTGKTGSGKSAFIHNLILSAAYKYSPDEVEIHLVDFKSAEQSTDFEGYKYSEDEICHSEGGNKYVYIPHVKYISLKSKSENALDVVNYVYKLMTERSATIGKFEEYNRNHPDKKVPQIYVIIDEYETMLSGGDSKDDGDRVEANNLRRKVRELIGKLCKKARVFGIGIIFAGQNFDLPADTETQINMRYGFFNDESQLRSLFSWDSSNKFDKYPKDIKKAAGYAYFANYKEKPIKFGRMAYAGGVDSDMIAEIAAIIRRKWQPYTDKHEQIIIGGTSSIVPKAKQYLTWDEDIIQRIKEARASADNEEQFLSSGGAETIKENRFLALGQSNSSNTNLGLEFKVSNTAYNYYCFGDDPTLRRIEGNAMMAFLYQTKTIKYDNPNIIFLDGGYKKVKSVEIDPYVNRLPLLNKRIEVLDEGRKMAVKILKIAKDLEKYDETKPILILMHGFEWFSQEKVKTWNEENRVEVEVDNKANIEFQKQIQSTNISISASLGSFLSQVNITQANSNIKKEDDEFKNFSFSELQEAFRKIYKNGSRYGVFMICTSNIYSEIVQNIINPLSKNDGVFLPAVFSSFEAMRRKTADDIANANNCYIRNYETIGSIRLYDYLNDNSSSWWDELSADLKK